MRATIKALEGRGRDVESQLKTLTNKANPTPADRDKMIALNAQIDEIDRQIKAQKDDELEQLRGVVSRQGGTVLSVDDSASRDFLAYLRTGEIRNASLSTTDANGGYVIPNPLLATLTEKVRKVDPILANATHFDLTGGQNATMDLPVKATHGVVTTAVETGARSEQDAPTFGSSALTCVDYYTDQRATQLWMDSTPGSEEIMLRWIVEDIYEQFGVDLAVGDGNGNAAGLFGATSYFSTKLSGAADAIANTNFLTLFTSLPAKYRANAAWLMNSATLSVCLAMDAPNSSAVAPLVTFDAAGVPTILGRPVLECSSAPSIGNGAYPIAFADIANAYATATHFGPSVLVDRFTATPKIRFYGLGRLGGAPWNPDACVLLKSDDA